jgi:hypothetical protein
VIPALFFELFLKSEHDRKIRPWLRRAFQGLWKSFLEKVGLIVQKVPLLKTK